VRVGSVGLAALPGGEDPRPRGQLRRHVNDLFAVGEQPVGDVLADAGTALDRPNPVRPLFSVANHRGVAVAVGREPASAVDGLVSGHDPDRCRALVRVHADDHAL
jgi:hypothetical protein